MAITRDDRWVQTAQGQAIAGAEVYYLTQPANVGALTPLANVYSNLTGTPAPNPQITDGLGHVGCYLDNGQLYTVVVLSPPQLQEQVYPDQQLSGIGSSASSLMTPQVPAGAINGTNVTFTLTQSPALLYLQQNGNLLIPGVGYTTAVVAGTFTITLAAAPEPGDSLYASGLL